jgi:hypothetical protein
MEYAMSDTSDLLYVRGEGRNVLPTPIVDVNLGNWEDRSGVIVDADTPYQLFGQGTTSTLSRFIVNIATQGVIWINFLGGDAEKNIPGSIPIHPGSMLTIPTRAPVSICSDTAGTPYTAGEA